MNFILSFLETIFPKVVFPDPIIPIKTRFLFDSISLFIEKTQICLILKIPKDICKYTKKQDQGILTF